MVGKIIIHMVKFTTRIYDFRGGKKFASKKLFSSEKEEVRKKGCKKDF